MFKEVPIVVLVPVTSTPTVGPMVDQLLVAIQEEPIEQVAQEVPDVVVEDTPLRIL